MTTKELLALVDRWRADADELTSVLDMMNTEGFIASQAEIELSRKHADELAPIATALCAEVEALRKDAERWRAYERELPVSARTVRTFVDQVIDRDFTELAAIDAARSRNEHEG